MKIIAFGASNSKNSINKALATYAASLVDGVEVEVEVLDLNDYEIPMFSEDKENEIGQPQLAKNFLAKLANADAIVTSYAEHNGSYTAAYKNLLDWSTRINREVFNNKPVVFLATSPGPGGAASVLQTATQSALFFGANVVATQSIPSFYDNFDFETFSLRNVEVKDQLVQTMSQLIK